MRHQPADLLFERYALHLIQARFNSSKTITNGATANGILNKWNPGRHATVEICHGRGFRRHCHRFERNRLVTVGNIRHHSHNFAFPPQRLLHANQRMQYPKQPIYGANSVVQHAGDAP